MLADEGPPGEGGHYIKFPFDDDPNWLPGDKPKTTSPLDDWLYTPPDAGTTQAWLDRQLPPVGPVGPYSPGPVFPGSIKPPWVDPISEPWGERLDWLKRVLDPFTVPVPINATPSENWAGLDYSWPF